MKHIRKFNESSSEINDDSILEIFDNMINITVALSDILIGNTIFIESESGEIYEYINGDVRNFWISHEEFKEETGLSLDDDYRLNKSDRLLELIEDGVDDYRVSHIKGIYLDGDATKMLYSVLGDNYF